MPRTHRTICNHGLRSGVSIGTGSRQEPHFKMVGTATASSVELLVLLLHISRVESMTICATKSQIKSKITRICQKIRKMIFQDDNARPHFSRTVKEMLEMLGWNVLPHPLYSLDFAPSEYYLFRFMQNYLSDQHFSSFEDI